jgi:hypothetical protein
VALFIILIAVEGYLLYLGQRLIFGQVYLRFGKIPAYLLSAPGTVLHELSHYLMCLVLGVRTGEVHLFHPQQHEDGSLTLGWVEHERSDPLRGALVAIAPVLVVPLLLLGVSVLLFGTAFVSDPVSAVQGGSWWQILIWVYVGLSAGQGAFPSAGDHVGAFGFLALLALGAAIYLLVPAATLGEAARVIALILALPAGAAGISLLTLRAKTKPGR